MSMLSFAAGLSFAPPLEDGLVRIPLTKMSATPRHIARENGLVGSSHVTISDFENAQYWPDLDRHAAAGLPGRLRHRLEQPVGALQALRLHEHRVPPALQVRSRPCFIPQGEGVARSRCA